MGFRRTVKKGIFSGLNVKRWVGIDHIKENGRIIGGLFNSLFNSSSKKETTRKETFEECMRRLNLSETDLIERIKSGKKIILFCLLGSGLTLIYLFYLLSYGRYLASVVTFVLTLLFLVYAFREHFNIYQIKQRRLGCSFKEYFNSYFKRPAK